MGECLDSRVTKRPLLPEHVLFSRPKKCVQQGFQNGPGFCLVGYLCFSVCPSQTSYYVLTCFGKGISLTFHLLARALTVERTVIGRPPSQCCQIHDNYPPKMIILSIWYDTSPFPIWQH